MSRWHGLSWGAYAMAVLVLTQTGTGCGRVDDDGDGEEETVVSTGGQGPLPPWGTGGAWIVEGCGSPTYQATQHCYWDCPGYDAERARCDPLCTSNPPADCPSNVLAIPRDPAIDVLSACDAVFPDGPSMGGWGGQMACSPVCGACSDVADCCLVTATAVCLEGTCVYR